MSGRIGITLGDVSGVAPEVTLKALAAVTSEDETRYLIIGDEGEVQRVNDRLKLDLTFERLAEAQSGERLCITSSFNESIPEKLPTGSPLAARAAVAWLADAAQRCLRRELDAVVTAPVNKEAIVRSGHTFVGQTEFLSQQAGAQRTAMMLLGHDERERWLRVALVTTHVSLKQVPAHVTPAKISLAIELAAQACADLGLPRARIAVCGLRLLDSRLQQ